MSGIVKNNLELIGGVASNADTHTITDTVDVQIFTNTTGVRTWAKPSWATTVYIECIGSGGGGGGGRHGDDAGGGGGGGSFVRGVFDANALEPTLDVVVGAMAPGGDANAAGTNGNSSEVRQASTEVVLVRAYGGGGGKDGGPNANARGGGGGGGGPAES